MTVKPLIGSISEVAADCLAIGVHDKQTEAPSFARGTPLGDTIVRLLESKDVTGALGDVTPLLGVEGPGGCSVVVFGLGPVPKDGESSGPVFSAGVALAKRLSARKRGHVAVVLPEQGEVRATASAITEGLIVGTRGPALRKSEPSRHAFDALSIVVPPGPAGLADLEKAVERGRVVGEAVNLARDLANTPPAEKPPRKLAELAAQAAAGTALEVTTWDAERIRNERFGGLLGVSAGSEEPPAFVVLDYHQGGETPHLALVGKGVTFDSGGLSLKPSASMEDMKSDMTGAAVVMAAMLAVARLKLPVNLRGYLVLSENMTGGRAMKLGDVLTMRNGKTVEVMNTDAEGRLILADALSYAAEAEPSRLIDLATLTGACLVALGTRTAGLFSNDDGFADRLLATTRLTGERAWRLPLDDDLKDGLKSHVADLKNIGGKWGGAIIAAKFLQEFVGILPWVHLDIAGPSWADTESATRDAGGTGCFVRTLVAYIESETIA